MSIKIFIYRKWCFYMWHIYNICTNLLVNVIVRLPHPRSGDIYIYICCNYIYIYVYIISILKTFSNGFHEIILKAHLFLIYAYIIIYIYIYIYLCICVYIYIGIYMHVCIIKMYHIYCII